MARLRTVQGSGRSGRLRRPSWILALAREGGLARPEPRSARELDASLPRECDLMARGLFQESRHAPWRVPGQACRVGLVAEASPVNRRGRNAVAASDWMTRQYRPVADPLAETDPAAWRLRGNMIRTPVQPPSESCWGGEGSRAADDDNL